MLAPVNEVTRQALVGGSLPRLPARGFIHLPVSHAGVSSNVFNALAEGRLRALVIASNQFVMSGKTIAVFNMQSRRDVLQLVMGTPQEDSYGLQSGYRLLPVQLRGEALPVAPTAEPTKVFAQSSFKNGVMFMENAPSLHEKFGQPFIDGSAVLIRGSERTVRAAVMTALDMPGIARHARLVSVPLAAKARLT